MKTQKQTINEMIAQIIAEARKLGYTDYLISGSTSISIKLVMA